MVAEDSVTIGGLHDELVAAGYAIRQHGGRLALCRDRELAMRSARLGGEHLRLTTPRLTRDERAAWLTAIDAVMLAAATTTPRRSAPRWPGSASGAETAIRATRRCSNRS